jgi:hypothetical protein
VRMGGEFQRRTCYHCPLSNGGISIESTSEMAVNYGNKWWKIYLK